MDGTPISSEAERDRVIQCLQAAVERRASVVNLLRERLIYYLFYILIFHLINVLSFFLVNCPQGVRLELCTADRPGLLADVTRTFRENGLNVTRCEISTMLDTAFNVFHVTGARGDPADPKIIESVRGQVGSTDLQVKELPFLYHEGPTERGLDAVGAAAAVLLSLGSMVRRNLYNLGLIS